MQHGPVLATCPHAPTWAVTLQMQPWADDDFIEYLLARHHQRCTSVMARVLASDGRDELCGSPELWIPVLDCMAANDSATNVRKALRHFINHCTPESSSRVLRHPCVKLIVRAGKIVAQLALRPAREALDFSGEKKLVAEVAESIEAGSQAWLHLAALAQERGKPHPAAATSILVRIDPGWRCPQWNAPCLDSASLGGVQWADIDLQKADLGHADLSNANLRGAILDGANLVKSDLRRTVLSAASLRRASCMGANFQQATLVEIVGDSANLAEADFSYANLTGSSLGSANFDDAILENANFDSAVLSRASLLRTRLRAANFEHADLSFAHLNGVDLTEANFRGACFSNAHMAACNLEYLKLPEADFSHANLRGAYLTGTLCTNARFVRADLRNAGLAEIEWENADLRGADLRGATFHMGSSRSGKVDSAIASEGTRTGFYTDDYEDQYFRPPEEIRKANLCGANLCDANILDVDFYMVDLRGAIYTSDQCDHFRRCKAILRNRI